MAKSRVVDLRPKRSSAPAPEPLETREPKRKSASQPLRERRSSLRERKRKIRAVITAGVSVCILLSAYAIHVASYLPRFTFQHVTVKGTQTTDPSLIQQFAEKMLTKSNTGYISGRNIFVYKFAPLEQMISAEFPVAKSVKVSRDVSLGNGIVIDITERTAHARWCAETGTQCYKLDDGGIVFGSAAGIATSSFTTQYLFTGPLSTSTSINVAAKPLGQMYAYGHMPGILTLLRLLAQGGHPVSGVSVQNEQDFYTLLQEGFYIKASFGSDATTLVRNLELVLASDALRDRRDKIEYVDLRFGNRVYYKLKGQAAVSPESEAGVSR